MPGSIEIRQSVHDFFVDCDARTKWFVDYLATRARSDANEVRINIFFVRPSDIRRRRPASNRDRAMQHTDAAAAMVRAGWRGEGVGGYRGGRIPRHSRSGRGDAEPALAPWQRRRACRGRPARRRSASGASAGGRLPRHVPPAASGTRRTSRAARHRPDGDLRPAQPARLGEQALRHCARREASAPRRR